MPESPKTLNQYTIRIPDLREASYPTADASVNDVVQNYHWVQSSLVGQLKNERLSNDQKTYAIYLTGQLRVIEAAPWLIDHIDFRADHVDPKTRFARWSEYPCVDALMELGRVGAGKKIYEKLAAEKNPTRARLMVRVILQVDGTKFGRLRIEKLIAAESDAAQVKRLKTALQTPFE
jgi:hypothetical protein